MVRIITIIVFLSLGIAFNSYAHDSNRSNREEQLEQEIEEIKERLYDEIESIHGNTGEDQEFVNSGDGWKSISNWRKLTPDMSYAEVRNILGEPHRIDGGSVAHWYYQNGAKAIFITDRLHSWVEPRQ